jgi:hypothetical protein
MVEFSVRRESFSGGAKPAFSSDLAGFRALVRHYGNIRGNQFD